MIDFHTHILPGIDDGSKNADESISMLKMLSEQSVDTVVASPHFYPRKSDVDTFLEKRNNAFEKLKEISPESVSNVLLGAELYFFDGISRADELPKLTIGKSRLLLIEMPFECWAERTVQELLTLTCRNDIIPVLAHIDRYLDMQKPQTIRAIIDRGILMQVNADSLLRFFARRRLLGMLAGGEIQFLGDDCHNTVSRPPIIEKAKTVIEKKLGKEFFESFDNNSRKYLNY